MVTVWVTIFYQAKSIRVIRAEEQSMIIDVGAASTVIHTVG